MKQIETILRPDKAVQGAFGLARCAHSSGIQATLDACSPHTVMQLQQANGRLYQTAGQALHQDGGPSPLLLDLDLTGLLAGSQSEGSTKGYFAKHLGAHGRQLCRVTATAFHEIVCQTLLPGNPLSHATLKPAIQCATAILHRPPAHPHDLLLRWDAGFGTDQNLNWLLWQGYQFLGKMYSQPRVRKLAQSVTHWQPTPSSPGREFGQVGAPHRYARKTTQVAVRTPKKSPPKTWAYGLLVTTLHHLSAAELVRLYDERGGGIETEFRADRQGLGLASRRKHRLAAQQMLLHLAERAHNLLMWTAPHLDPPLNEFGLLRLVRDVLSVNGYLCLHANVPIEIGLNWRHPYAEALRAGFNRLLNGTPQVPLWEPNDVVKEQDMVNMPPLDHCQSGSYYKTMSYSNIHIY